MYNICIFIFIYLYLFCFNRVVLAVGSVVYACDNQNICDLCLRKLIWVYMSLHPLSFVIQTVQLLYAADKMHVHFIYHMYISLWHVNSRVLIFFLIAYMYLYLLIKGTHRFIGYEESSSLHASFGT